jgi:hypothetical protein
MSELRTHLESAKAAYGDLHYPGDLAADLRPPVRRWMWIAPLSISAAAAIALALVHRAHLSPAAPPDLPPAVAVQDQPPSPPLEFPDDVPLAPPYQAISMPAMPSFPSWEAATQGVEPNRPSTQESV